MEVTLDKQGASYGLATVKIGQADYQSELDKQLKDYQKKANIKGFRPGKVPLGLIRKMVGKDLKADVVTRKVSDNLNEYVQSNDLKLMFNPLPKEEPLTLDDFANQDEFAFSFELCMEPDFEYDLKNVALTQYEVEPTTDEVNDVIEKIKKDTPNVVKVEEVAEGDFIEGTFKQVDGEFEESTTLPLNQVAEDQRATFIGKKADEVVKFDLKTAFPEEKTVNLLFNGAKEQETELSGEFELTIKEITRNETPEMNKDFFQKALGKEVETEEEFRSELVQLIKDGNQTVAEDLVARDIRNQLVETTTIELHEEFLKRLMRMSKEDGISDEEVEKQYPDFAKSLKWRMLSNRIFRDSEIKIEEAEITEAARETVRASLRQMGLANLGGDQLEQFVDMMLEKEEAKQKGIEDGYELIFNQKLNGYIKENATVDAKTVGIEEFKSIVDDIVAKDQAATATTEEQA